MTKHAIFMKYALVSWFDLQKATRYTQLIDEMFYGKKENPNCIAMLKLKLTFICLKKGRKVVLQM